jgi:outer membrane lipase/esterase
MNRSFFSRIVSAGALVVATIASVPAHAGPYSSLFVFGDSLSDSGNNYLAGAYDPSQVIMGNTYIPSYTYAVGGVPTGAYSNGPVWASYFASMIGVPLLPSLAGGGNYAFGGATTGPVASPPPGGPFPPSLLTQTQMFLGSHPGPGGAPADALYVVAGGGNNARAGLTAMLGGADPVATAFATATAFAADVGTIVDELQAAGAQHIVVWNTPNLGLAPAVVAGGGAGAGSFLASVMNQALAARLSIETDVTTFDLFGFGTLLATNPGAFGISNITTACGSVSGADCSQYAYWDGIHPTTAAHYAIAGAMYAAAVPVPEPETYALLAFGLVAVALQARRRTKGSAIAA